MLLHPRAEVDPEPAAGERWVLDGNELAGYLINRTPASADIVLFLYGNACNATAMRHDLLLNLPLRYNVACVEYVGYGFCRHHASGGAASSAESIKRIHRCLHDLLRRGLRVHVMAQSVGTMLWSQAMLESDLWQRVCSIRLITPFASVGAVARRFLPYIVGFFVTDNISYDAAAAWRYALSRLPADSHWRTTSRVQLFIAGADEVVGAEQGRELARAIPGAVVDEFPGRRHNDLLQFTRVWSS